MKSYLYLVATIICLSITDQTKAQCFSTGYDPGLLGYGGASYSSFSIATGNRLLEVYNPTNYGLLGGFGYGNGFFNNRFYGGYGFGSPFFNRGFYGSPFYGDRSRGGFFQRPFVVAVGPFGHRR